MISYIKRHFKGEFSIAQSFWINFICVNFSFNFLAAFIALSFKENKEIFPYFILNLQLLTCPIAYWQSFGIYQSYLKHKAQMKTPFWGLLASILSFLSFFGSIYGVLILLFGVEPMSLLK